MKRADVRRMDAHLLYSMINMRLRNDYEDLDDLVRALDLDRAELEARLADAGYVYRTERGQFRAVDAG